MVTDIMLQIKNIHMWCAVSKWYVHSWITTICPIQNNDLLLLLQVLSSLFRRLTIMLDHLLLFSAILLTLPYFVHSNHSATSENQVLLLQPRHAFPSINPSVIFIIKSLLDPRKMWPKYASFLFASDVDSGTVLLSFSLIDLFVVCYLQLIFNMRLYVHIQRR